VLCKSRENVKGSDRERSRLGWERKETLEEVQGILEIVLRRVKSGNTGEKMGWKETSGFRQGQRVIYWRKINI
jgi:hypothetical protein